MLHELIAPALGGVVGLLLAVAGAGGGIVAVPLLVFGLHLPLVQAAPIGLLAVALAAGLGAFLGWRADLLRYKAAAVMALGGVAATPLGLWVAQRVPNGWMTVFFALVLTGVAARTFRQGARELRGDAAARPMRPVCRLDPATGKLHWTWACGVRLASAGAVAGFLSGLLGVGGGFVLVPVLLAVSDLPMKAIVATSMGVLALVSGAAVLQASLGGQLAWPLAWPFVAGAVGGLLLGRVAAARLAGPRLQQGFALLSLGIAAGLMLRAAAA